MKQQSKTRYSKLIFSILTACGTGVVVVFLVITGIEIGSDIMLNNRTQSASVINLNTTLSSSNEIKIEEEEQDPSFVSKFSRVFIYSADNGKEIIESAKNSLPKITNINVTAKSYAVIDFDRNAILLEKNSEKLMPIASVTKLVTAVVAKKLLNQNNTVNISQKVLNTYGNEGWLRIGEKIKISELLYPLLMVSSNDASEALAQSYVYGRKNFIKEMNEWVNNIGAYRTYFTDPSGLSPTNVSTTKDLGIITNWIIKNDPEIFKITLLKSKKIRTHVWVNPTHFLNLSSYEGGKNGYTPEANRTSVSLFKLGNAQKIYGVVLLGSANRDADILNLLQEALK